MAADYKLTWMQHPAPEGAPQFFAILGNEVLNERVLQIHNAPGLTIDGDPSRPTVELVDYCEATSQCHARNAKRFLNLLMTNSGLYIKIGQVMAATVQNLPRAYKEWLKRCMQDSPTMSFAEVQSIVEEELGCNLNSAFEYFNEIPLASASIAQVHEARLRGTGEKVAVKVQHRALAGDFGADMFAQWACLNVAPYLFKGFELAWMHDEIEFYLEQELNFEREARNGERAARNFTENPRIKVPNIYWQCTTKRVLTMEFMEAFPIGDFDSIRRCGISYAAVGGLVIEAFAEQIFEHGFVHCDPHTSNVFVQVLGADGKTILPSNATRKNVCDFRVILLDHGLYRELDEQLRLQYCALWKSMIMRDDAKVKQVCDSMGVGDYWITMASMVLMRPYLPLTSALIPLSHAESFSREQLKDFMSHFSVDKVMQLMKLMPRPLFLVLRNQNYVRGLNKELGMPVNRFRLMANMALRALDENQRWYRRWWDRLVFQTLLIVQDWTWGIGVYLLQWRVSKDANEVEREMLENMQ